MNLKKLIEERNKKMNELEKILKTVDNEQRAMTEEEEKKFDELRAEIDKMDNTIEKAKSIKTQKEIKTGEEETKKEENRAEQDEIDFANYIRGTTTRNDELRAESRLEMSKNGAVIPKTIANKIIDKVKEIAPIYQRCTRYNLGGDLVIPYYEDSSDVEVAYADEFTDLEAKAGSFGSVELKNYLAGSLTKISKSLINNSQFDITSFTIYKMSKAFARWIEKELLFGTKGKMEGLSGIKENMTVTSESPTEVTSDELIDVQDKVIDEYQAESFWIMNRETRSKIRKLKDKEGRYLLNQDFSSKWGYTLLGKDVYCSDNVPKMEAGKTAIFYGDYSGLACKISEEVSLEILLEKYATQHAVGIVGWMELDAKIEDAQKIACLKCKAA